MTEPPVSPAPRPGALTETTTKANAAPFGLPGGALSETTSKANAALGGGALGGTLGAAIATAISYLIWKGSAPPGLEGAIAVIVTALLSAGGAWLSTYYAQPNRPMPPPA